MSPRDGAAPYLDFYRANDISPVRQDVSDLARHYSRRGHLYRSLGLPPFAICGKSVLEIGPGSGHNALYTASLKPARYVLLDGNERGLMEAHALLEARFPEGAYDFVLSPVEAFESGERFDLVLAEGLIPHQADPAAMARRVSRFVAPGGVLVVTCADHVSVLSEAVRRLIRDRLIDCAAPLAEQLAVLRPIFASHYAALPSASRPLDDWLADTIVMPWRHRLFSISDAIGALADEFDIYGSSPRFLTDWRWYKDVHGDAADLNGRARRQYLMHQSALVDGRIDPSEFRYEVEASYIVTLAQHLFARMQEIEGGKGDGFNEVADICAEIAFALPGNAAAIDALREAADFFRGARDPFTFSALPSWWGRGQQYLSFIRKAA